MMHQDIKIIARIHNDAFPQDCLSFDEAAFWIRCKFSSWPINKYYVATNNNIIEGYILWIELGGFRINCVLELEQIAVKTDCRRMGIGTRLIDFSLEFLFNDLKSDDRVLKLIEVTTANQNEAQRLYKKSLNAKIEAVKKGFFDDDEVVMISRLSSLNESRESRGLLVF